MLGMHILTPSISRCMNKLSLYVRSMLHLGSESRWTIISRINLYVWERGSPHLTADQRINSIICNCEPDVRLEVRNMQAHTQRDPEQILAGILRIFGERRHPHELACCFYSSQQRPGEAIHLYANRLQRSFERLTRREATLGHQVTLSVTLRQKFVSGLQDPSLQMAHIIN